MVLFYIAVVTMHLCPAKTKVFKYIYKQVQSKQLRILDWLLQQLTYINIQNALSRTDRPHNIGITTLLFMIDVYGLF